MQHEKPTIQSPFHTFSKSSERKLTIVLGISLIVFISIMRYFDGQIQHAENTQGIVSFELAKELATSEAILNSWDPLSKTAAGMSMGFDFLFLIVYALFISIIIHKLNERLWKHSSIYSLGSILIWAVFLAALFDSIENIALIKLLMGDLKQLWSSIAYYFAIAKFSLLAISILFILFNSVLLLFREKIIQ